MTEDKDLDMTCHLSGVYTDHLPIYTDKAVDRYHIRKKTLLFSNIICTSSVMLKKEVPFRFNENKRYSEDYMLWLEILFRDSRCDLIKCPLTYTYKKWYATGGLSSRLLKMEKAELSNYYKLLKQRKIGSLTYLSASLVSIAKFFKRLLQGLIYKSN